MTIVGGAIEQKDLGLSIGTNGTFSNTELTAEGKVRLQVVGTTSDNRNIFAESGEWISEVVGVQDKFKEYGKLFTSHTSTGSASIKIFSRTSNDGSLFGEWVEVLADGTIQSEKKLYIQVKIEFTAGRAEETHSFGDIAVLSGTNLFAENQYIETSGGLKLKRSYQRDLAIDATWVAEGSVHRIPISRSEWTRIDSLAIPVV